MVNFYCCVSAFKALFVLLVLYVAMPPQFDKNQLKNLLHPSEEGTRLILVSAVLLDILSLPLLDL